MYFKFTLWKISYKFLMVFPVFSVRFKKASHPGFSGMKGFLFTRLLWSNRKSLSAVGR